MILRMSLFIGFVLLGTGCQSPKGPEVLTIQPDQYQEAFSTMVEMVRNRGWEPELMDRRSGVIESGPVQAGSIFEPWHLNTTEMSTIVENSLSQTRTRVRVEFRPQGQEVFARSNRDELTSPDYLGITDTPDLTQCISPMDLRVWVYIEHGHTPNIMRSTWSGRTTSRPRRNGYDSTWERPPAGTVWIPSSRDRTAEMRLLTAISESLQTDQPVQTAQDSPPS